MQNIQAEIWKTEQEILNVIHDICMEHNLRYSLAYGTLIGAVRHKGFIPWDDDLDIMMPREDYEKLLSIWNQVAPKEYIIQNIYTDKDFTQNFTKIRKNHTTFLQTEDEREKQYHKGIFVDIFPADRVASGKFGRKIQYVACAVNLLYSRGFNSGMTSGMKGKIENVLLALPERLRFKLRDSTEKIIKRWNVTKSGKYFFPCTIRSCKWYYPPDLFQNLDYIEFNGKQYLSVKDYDSYLKISYGDYMQLPPEEERVWKHHPIIIDFEHNYEELTEK